jgi:hypothetical protein
MNMKGQLKPEQAAFMAPTKPEFELFDLQQDPHEVNNLADDPKYAKVKRELLAELENWRENVIRDQGVADTFRAESVYPETCPTPVMDDWVEANNDNYDFLAYGWPAWYPTRTLEEWEKTLAIWEPYVMRDANDNMRRPDVVHTKKKK